MTLCDVNLPPDLTQQCTKPAQFSALAPDQGSKSRHPLTPWPLLSSPFSPSHSHQHGSQVTGSPPRRDPVEPGGAGAGRRRLSVGGSTPADRRRPPSITDGPRGQGRRRRRPQTVGRGCTTRRAGYTARGAGGSLPRNGAGWGGPRATGRREGLKGDVRTDLWD